MGWSSGSKIGQNIVNAYIATSGHIRWESRRDFYVALINALEDGDCDTIDEINCDDMGWKAALGQTNWLPEDDEDDDICEECKIRTSLGLGSCNECSGYNDYLSEWEPSW